MGLLRRLTSWIIPPQPAIAADAARTKKSFQDVCMEDPEAAREFLLADQAALSADMGRLFQQYHARMKELESRAATLSPEQLEFEAAKLKDVQERIKIMIRRFDASMKETADLERELRMWEERSGEPGEKHADHPDVRAEIARSELQLRGRDVLLRNDHGIDTRFAQALLDPRMRGDDGGRVDERQSEIADGNADGTHARDVAVRLEGQDEYRPVMPTVEHLLTAIREAAREGGKWHGIAPDAHDEDTLLQVRQYRDLNGLLRRLDRRSGTRRDRMALAIRMH